MHPPWFSLKWLSEMATSCTWSCTGPLLESIINSLASNRMALMCFSFHRHVKCTMTVFPTPNCNWCDGLYFPLTGPQIPISYIYLDSNSYWPEVGATNHALSGGDGKREITYLCCPCWPWPHVPCKDKPELEELGIPWDIHCFGRQGNQIQNAGGLI